MAGPFDKQGLTTLVHRGAIRTMTKTLSPPPPQAKLADRSASSIRLTITVTPEVHAAFTRMGEVTSLPVGRCMGEWLADTLEGAEFLTAQLLKAREAPRQVIREMRQMALGSADEMAGLLEQMRRPRVGGAAGDSKARAVATAEAPTPRPVIRGVKSPSGAHKQAKRRGKP